MREVILALLTTFLFTAAQADEPTPAQRAACLPDALRYCIRLSPDGTATLDRAGIERCMREHKDQLSRACKETFR